MKEIEVGEYVRTKNGISKVIENVDKYVTEEQICVDFISGMYHQVISKHRIVKHSKQLIDIIEVGDIVKDKYNKYEVAFVKDDKIYCNDYNLDDSLITLREQDIKAILTKEQFEANCYKVGGEDE